MRFSVLLISLLAAGAASISGCAGPQELLQPISPVQVDEIDLAGTWIMLDDVNTMENRIQQAVRQTDGVDESELLRGMMSSSNQDPRRRRRRGSVGGLVHVFLENARRLRISQTDAGLFIAFDRSIVEEYRYGEMRRVSKGGAVAQRASGWEPGGYRIETLGEEGMKLTERYMLQRGGDELVREIVLRSAELDEVTIVQTFERQR